MSRFDAQLLFGKTCVGWQSKMKGGACWSTTPYMQTAAFFTHSTMDQMIRSMMARVTHFPAPSLVPVGPWIPQEGGPLMLFTAKASLRSMEMSHSQSPVALAAADITGYFMIAVAVQSTRKEFVPCTISVVPGKTGNNSTVPKFSQRLRSAPWSMFKEFSKQALCRTEVPLSKRV